jgi:xylulokinase
MYLGIDLGTSGVKIVIIDNALHMIASESVALTVSRSQPNWSEQNPLDWFEAVDHAFATLKKNSPDLLAAVRAIGLSGQMHGAVLVDKSGHVLRPAILWNDGRSFEQCAQLESTQPQSRAITGNLAMPGFTAPKLLWVAQNEPLVFAAIDKVLLPKDWLRFELTGDFVSEMSDASGTLWLDVGARQWSAKMLASCQLTERHMPKLVEGSAASGILKPSLVQRWGLKGQIMVAGGAGDNAASAVGIGVVQPGQGFVSLGTSGVVFLADDRFRPAPQHAVHAFAHAIPNRWHQMSVMLSAASALTWAKSITGDPDEANLLARAEQLPQKQRALAPLFLPYLSGERTPHNNPHASGVLIGLRHEHQAADMAYAVAEGVSFGLMDGWAAMHGGVSQDSRVVTNELALVGGGARNDFFAQLLSSGLNMRLRRRDDAPNAAAVGAARLAWLADGGQLDGLDAVDRAHSENAVCFSPIAQQYQLLNERFSRFKAVYQTLKPLF